jgi:shikimate dehydrogenase
LHFARGWPFAYNADVPGAAGIEITASTRFCAVLGHPIRHSASPAMHNAAIEQLGLNWRYLAMDVAPEELRAAIAGAKAMRFIGLNLTVPHKLLAVGFVDVLAETAAKWGAVNTIRFEGRTEAGEWRPLAEFGDAPPGDRVRACGFNTDAEALTQALREELGMEMLGKTALIVGAGGAGRVAALKLAQEGARELWLANRTESKAETVAEEVSEQYPDVAVRLGYPGGQRVDLVLNATSVGLRAGDGNAVPEDRFDLAGASAAYDMIYRPAETPFLAAARAAGCRVANGLGMLLYQGAKAFELWTGRAAPVEVMRRALESNVYGGSCN